VVLGEVGWDDGGLQARKRVGRKWTSLYKQEDLYMVGFWCLWFHIELTRSSGRQMSLSLGGSEVEEADLAP
jgi:hypothetical protein